MRAKGWVTLPRFFAALLALYAVLEWGFNATGLAAAVFAVLAITAVILGFRLIRRARGRAVTVSPAEGVEVGVNADGELGSLRGRRSWWVEPSAWAVYR